MRDESNNADVWLHATVHALSTPPDITPPPDFVARTMARLPREMKTVAFGRAAHTLPTYGLRAAWSALALLMAAMVVLARSSTGTAMSVTVQGLVFAQFAAIALIVAAFGGFRGRV